MKKILPICFLFWCFAFSLSAQGIQIVGTVTAPLCFGDANASINVVVMGGQPPYFFNWSNGETNQNINAVSSGVYTITVTDAVGATNTQDFTINQPEPLVSVLSSVEPISCSGGADGEVTATAIGGTAPYTFSWSTGNTDASISNLNAGNYLLTTTDANGCTAILNISVDEPIAISLEARLYSCESVLGNDGEVTIMATGGTPPYTYLWSDGATTSNAIRNDLTYGGYSVTVEDAEACTVVVDDVQVCHSDMVLPNSFVLCQSDEQELFVSAPGAVAYAWSPTNGLSCTNCPNPIATPTTTTTYTVAITSPGMTEFLHNLTITVDQNCVWPGDIDSSGNVSHFDLLPIGLAYEEVGPTRYLASNNWSGQFALSWPTTVPGAEINLRHVDANGDGLIDSEDKNSIEQNWEQQLSFSNGVSPYPDILLVDTLPFYVEVDTFQEGQTLSFPVILGTDDFPEEDIYGIAFSIDYDSSLFVPGSAYMSFDESWLGTIDVDMIAVQREFSTPGRLDVAIVRTDKENVNGIGAIGNYIITVEDDILLHDPNGGNVLVEELETTFPISNVRLINKDGFQMMPYLPTQIGLLTELGTGLENEKEWGDLIKMFPNPAQDKVVLDAKNIKLDHYQLFNVTGLLVEEKQLGGVSRFSTSVAHLPNGTYWIRLSTASKLYTGKLVVLK